MFVDNFISTRSSQYRGGIVNEFTGGGVMGMHWEPGLRRPYFDKNGKPAVTINLGNTTLVKGEQRPIKQHVLIRDVVNNMGIMSPVFNATALRKEEWNLLDQVVLRAARFRLRAYADLAASNTYGGFNGMAKSMLEHETVTDPGEAIEDMDGLSEGRTDSPIYQLQGLPLTITHSDFWTDSRKLAMSRNTGTPIDTLMGEACGRRVAERIEKTTIGVSTGMTYGGNSTQVGGYGRVSAVYGYINFPARLTKANMTVPTGSNSANILNDVLACLDLLKAQKFYGPFMVYTSSDYDRYMDADYQVFTVGGSNYGGVKTLRQRIKDIEDIQDVRRLDFLFGAQLSSTIGPGTDVDVTLKSYRLLFVQMTPDVARAVNGMDITTIQWESVGGMRLNFKVLCIQVPQLRADAYSNCGILDATNS